MPEVIPKRTRHDADPSAAHRAIRDATLAAYASLLPTIRQLRDEGHSFEFIARRLNDSGHRTRTGATFDHGTVRRILRRADASKDEG